MNYKKIPGAAIKILVVVLVILALVPSTQASEYKTLHAFTGTDGYFPTAGLIFDRAGNLYGTTQEGGAENLGTVFELTPNADGSWTESVLHSFTGMGDGASPLGGLLFDTSGSLYGTTLTGGNLSQCNGSGCGVVFQLAPNLDGSWTETLLHTFTGSDGVRPLGLLFDTSGNLYGMTELGGNLSQCGGYGCGVVFQLTPDADGSWKEEVLHHFTGGNDGRYPLFASLILDQAGDLYGTTQAGGNLSQCNGNGCGVVFTLIPNANGRWKEQVLHRFTGGNDGSQPVAGVIFDTAGNLYGTTVYGGNLKCSPPIGCGVVFQLTPNADGSWKENVLHRFMNRDGSSPLASLIFDTGGNLYGTAEVGGNLGQCNGIGCGVVFKLTPNSKGGWKEIVLHSFLNHPGVFPYAGVIFDAAGNLYGTTSGYNNETFGSVFEIKP